MGTYRVFFRNGSNIVGRFDLCAKDDQAATALAKPYARPARTSAMPSRCGMAATASARGRRPALRAASMTS
jgi:hypothetical protein